MSFAEFNLDPSIVKAVTASGYTQPTPVQLRSIPEIMNGRDIVASAQTGTGKTASFVLPALHRLSLAQTGNRKPRILILTPTRELARQITDAANKYGKFLKFKIISLVGGMPYRQQLKDLSQPVDIIIATPGRLMDHMDSRKLDLSGIEMLILDEADRMLDMGFVDDVKLISKATPHDRQTLLFSATVDNKLTQIINSFLKNPVRIDLSKDKMSPADIKQEVYVTDSPAHKARLLQHFLRDGNIFKAIIFSATKVNADKLARQLYDQGLSAAALHGDLKQSMRNKIIERMKQNKIQFLVATDVAARGIDINDLTHVINYDLPKFCEDYVHRIGRTGRAGKSGVAISFALPSDARNLQRIERYTNQRFQMSTVPGLEPTSRISTSAPAAGKSKSKKSFSGKSYGQSNGKPSYGKSSKPWERDRKPQGPGEESKYAGAKPRVKKQSSWAKAQENNGNAANGENKSYARKSPPWAQSNDRNDRSERNDRDAAPKSYGKPKRKSYDGDTTYAGAKASAKKSPPPWARSNDNDGAPKTYGKPKVRSAARDTEYAGPKVRTKNTPPPWARTDDSRSATITYAAKGKKKPVGAGAPKSKSKGEFQSRWTD